ncbi:replication initiation protein RepM [Acinetobacter sp. YH12036]|uniref:replication initiation protein RepM n=1 Tax=Acinetobacter sp. YH12036 TaxID=2601046 RepID=UPI0015D2B803|nr:replication initiation protein RepM [Acinetobacter sp. YH12036]
MGLVVKDNSLINASYTLSLVEQRLILLAIIEARETGKGIDTDTFLEIHAQHYADRFHVDVKNTYAMLSEAVMTLFNRQVTYMTMDEKRNKPEKRVVRWVSGISYVEGAGIVKLRFAPEIVPLITRLEQNFTSYELMQVSNLNLYATRLYELLVCWRSTGKTPIIEISEFRSRIGLQEHEYKPMNNFKNRVLEPAIKQINEHTDITVKVEQHKTGRSITGFSFKFKQKQQPKSIESNQDLNTTDLFAKMTDAQRHMFSHKLSEMPEMAKYSQGTETYQQFAVRIADMLLQPEKFEELYLHLVRAGYQ